MRLLVIVTGVVLGGVLGFIAGLVGAEFVVNALGHVDEADYMAIKLLGPLGATVAYAVAGGAVGARLTRR